MAEGILLFSSPSVLEAAASRRGTLHRTTIRLGFFEL